MAMHNQIGILRLVLLVLHKSPFCLVAEKTIVLSKSNLPAIEMLGVFTDVL